MDARELLRRYIEQRREVGETELVLDGMQVDEVMRLLGAAGKTRSSAPVSKSSRTVAAGGDDWRATLREAGAGGGEPNTAATAEPDSPTARAGSPIERAPDASAPIDRRPSVSVPAEKVGRLDFAPLPANADASSEVPFKRGLVIGVNEAEIIPDHISQLPSLDAIAGKVQECRRCPLYATATHAVPGEGDPNAGLVCVGEAPGANEDATGRPFVGQAGQLLTKILAAIDLKREEVFIVNVLKHRPPGNRNPQPAEVEACSPYLIRQLELIKPKVIVAFGTFAAQTLLQTKTPLGQLRGLVHRYHGTPLVVTYHPAALLRTPAWKRPTLEDVKLVR